MSIASPAKEAYHLLTLLVSMTFNLFLAIALSSMIPVTELRATIPIFIARNPDVPVLFITGSAIIGNMVPNFFLLWFLPQLTEWLHDHVAPRINSTVIGLHRYVVKKNRIYQVYSLVILLMLISWAMLHSFEIMQPLWYVTTGVVIPLFSYIAYLIANKAYRAAMEEKSIIHWFYNKVHKEHSQKFYRWGSVALVAIVGIPLPGTGSWTGSVLAFLFNIPYWKALGLIFLGILIAASIVTGLSTGILSGLAVF